MASNAVMSEPQATAPGTAAGDRMDALAARINDLSTGDRATLRRMVLKKKYAVDGIVVKALSRTGANVPMEERFFAGWRMVAHVAAVLAGTAKLAAHHGKSSLGGALFEADYSENRLLRLLASRGEGLDDQVMLAARMVARKGKGPVNLWTLRDLMGHDAARAEAARIRIARDYYAAEARSEKGDGE